MCAYVPELVIFYQLFTYITTRSIVLATPSTPEEYYNTGIMYPLYKPLVRFISSKGRLDAFGNGVVDISATVANIFPYLMCETVCDCMRVCACYRKTELLICMDYGSIFFFFVIII